MDQKTENQGSREDRYKLFLKLFRENEDVLFGFIMKLIPNYSVAEDVMQETMMVMWEKFDTFQEGTSFIAWAKQIARYKTIGHVRKSQRRSMVHFSDNVIEELANQEPSAASQNEYLEALQNCIHKLRDRSRKIIQLRYLKEMKVKDIASLMGLTHNALSKHMSRIHHSLKNCVERTLHAWDVTNG